MMRNPPNEGIDFFDRVLNLVVRIGRFDTELKNESVDFVHNKGNFDTFLHSVSNDIFRADHKLLPNEKTTKPQKGKVLPLLLHPQREECRLQDAWLRQLRR